MVFTDGKSFAMVSLRGDRQVNEAKLKAKLNWAVLEPAEPAHFVVPEGSQQFSIEGPVFGYVGPIDHATLGWIAKENRFVDAEVVALDGPFVAGANEKGHHVKNVVVHRDLHPVNELDVRVAQAGDVCGRCGKGHYRAYRGIEVGHVFFLGTKYSQPMKCNFLDADGQDKPMIMGCYGIGVTRIAAAAIEQNHDDNGIIWPLALAPFQVLIVTAGKEAELAAAAEKLEKELQERGIEVLYDDRDERGGVKFKDADLVGIPLRVTIGKRGLAEGKLELKGRREKEARLVPAGEIAAELEKLVRS
jgi:prolyl-tRNA synthetase